MCRALPSKGEPELAARCYAKLWAFHLLTDNIERATHYQKSFIMKFVTLILGCAQKLV